MNAFNPDTTDSKTFTDVDGREITVRPVFDAGLNRTVVELNVNGATARLSNGVIPNFVDIVVMAAFLGETANIAEGNPTPAGE